MTELLEICVVIVKLVAVEVSNVKRAFTATNVFPLTGLNVTFDLHCQFVGPSPANVGAPDAREFGVVVEHEPVETVLIDGDWLTTAASAEP